MDILTMLVGDFFSELRKTDCKVALAAGNFCWLSVSLKNSHQVLIKRKLNRKGEVIIDRLFCDQEEAFEFFKFLLEEDLDELCLFLAEANFNKNKIFENNVLSRSVGNRRRYYLLKTLLLNLLLYRLLSNNYRVKLFDSFLDTSDSDYTPEKGEFFLILNDPICSKTMSIMYSFLRQGTASKRMYVKIPQNKIHKMVRTLLEDRGFSFDGNDGV